MQGQQKQLPGVDFKKLKKILKKCRKDFESHQDHDGQSCPHHCPGTQFYCKWLLSTASYLFVALVSL